MAFPGRLLWAGRARGREGCVGEKGRGIWDLCKGQWKEQVAWPMEATKRLLFQKGPGRKTAPTPGIRRRTQEVAEKPKGHREHSEATQRPAVVGSCYHPGSGGTGGKRGDATRAQMGAGSTQKMQPLPGTRPKPAKGEKKCQLHPSSCAPVSYMCLH